MDYQRYLLTLIFLGPIHQRGQDLDLKIYSLYLNIQNATETVF